MLSSTEHVALSELEIDASCTQEGLSVVVSLDLFLRKRPVTLVAHGNKGKFIL